MRIPGAMPQASMRQRLWRWTDTQLLRFARFWHRAASHSCREMGKFVAQRSTTKVLLAKTPGSGSMCLSGHCLAQAEGRIGWSARLRVAVETDRSNLYQGTKMKQIRTSFNMIGVIALLALTVGCAT